MHAASVRTPFGTAPMSNRTRMPAGPSLAEGVGFYESICGRRCVSESCPRYVTILRPPTRRLQSFWGRYECCGDGRGEFERVSRLVVGDLTRQRRGGHGFDVADDENRSATHSRWLSGSTGAETPAPGRPKPQLRDGTCHGVCVLASGKSSLSRCATGLVRRSGCVAAGASRPNRTNKRPRITDRVQTTPF